MFISGFTSSSYSEIFAFVFFHRCMFLPSTALSLTNLQLLHLRLWSKMGWACLLVLRLETSKNKLKTRCIKK